MSADSNGGDGDIPMHSVMNRGNINSGNQVSADAVDEINEADFLHDPNEIDEDEVDEDEIDEDEFLRDPDEDEDGQLESDEGER